MRPALDPLSFPDAAFVGDTLVVDVKGRHLTDIEKIYVKPERGVGAMLGDPLATRPAGRTIEVGPDRLTITVTVAADAQPGDRRIWVESSGGESNQLLLIVML